MDLALLSDVDHLDQRADRVSLMTLHAAKGLEFPVVFVVGCEDGLLPYRPASENQVADLEEERRLFYVGMTRAQQKLNLTRSQKTNVIWSSVRSFNSHRLNLISRPHY